MNVSGGSKWSLCAVYTNHSEITPRRACTTYTVMNEQTALAVVAFCIEKRMVSSCMHACMNIKTGIYDFFRFRSLCRVDYSRKLSHMDSYATSLSRLSSAINVSYDSFLFPCSHFSFTPRFLLNSRTPHTLEIDDSNYRLPILHLPLLLFFYIIFLMCFSRKSTYGQQCRNIHPNFDILGG